MSPGELERILGRLPFAPRSVILNGTGEPLLHPGFFELVDTLARRGVRCRFHTNGTLLPARIIQGILSRTNINQIAVSCDGAAKETFESLRVGASFERWKDGARELLCAINRRPSRSPLVLSLTVLSKRNLPQLRDIIRLSAEIGFHRTHFLDMIPVDPAAGELALSDEECGSIDVRSISAFGETLGVGVSFYLRQLPRSGRIRCLQPWEHMFVQSGGHIRPCCAVFGSETDLRMGNVLEQPFSAIWQGAAYQQFRETYAAGTNRFCKVCPYG